MSSAVNHLQIPEEEHPRKGKPPSLPTANEVTHSPGKISLRESFREGNVAKFWEGVRKKSHSELCLVLRLMRGSGSTDDEKIPKERYSASTGNLRRRGRRQVIAWQNYTPHHLQKQFMLVQEEKAMQAVPSMPIDASKFVAYVTERRKKRILFKGEYLMILRSIDPVKCISTVGESLINRNTYPDTLPYDYNRVVLNALPGDENSHYINASYVNSWVREKAYVVTQAVKTKPANVEFWRMVWELESTCIVMLTKVFDFMRVMCMQYWPVTSFQYGTILVETLETKTYAHFVIRNLRLTRVENGEGMHSRELRHFHFTEWELDSFPYISAFIELRRRVRKFTDKCRSDAPIIVHCSNGGGRSGAFLALDANLELLKKTGHIDVYEYAKLMVNSRPHLVDSVDQYRFIYEALSEAVLCNIAPIPLSQLKERSSMYKAKKNRELMEAQDAHENKLLMMLTPTLRIGDCAGGHRLENRGKNRDVMVVPPDHARPYLQTLHGESKDYTYINAVEIDGFTRKNEFIVTEWPKQSTIDSFWTLVFDHSCHTIVNLSNQGNHKVYPTFLHRKGKRTYGPFIVEVLNYHQYPSMTSHMVKVMKKQNYVSLQPPGMASNGGTISRSSARLSTRETEAFSSDELVDRWDQSYRFNPIYQGHVHREHPESPSSKWRSHKFRRRHATTSNSRSASQNPSSPSSENMCVSFERNSGNERNSRSRNNAGDRCDKDDSDDDNGDDNQCGDDGASGEDVLSSDGETSEHEENLSQIMGLERRRKSVAFVPPEKTFMISEVMSTSSQHHIEAEVQICCVIQVRMWPIENKVPLSTSGLIDMIKMARSWKKRAPDRPHTKPTIVMSHNGVSRCGIFIAANVCIDQMNMDHEVDVFHAVKMIRINRPQLIDMKDEYKYLYDLMLHWYMTNPEYRRFDSDADEMSAANVQRTASTRGSIRSKKSSTAERNLHVQPAGIVPTQ